MDIARSRNANCKYVIGLRLHAHVNKALLNSCLDICLVLMGISLRNSHRNVFLEG